MSSIFDQLPGVILQDIADMLDPQSFSNVAQASRDFTMVRRSYIGNGPFVNGFTFNTGTLVTSTSASVSFASSPSNMDSEFHGNTDTDMTSSPEEDDWEFEITDDMLRRLSLIPSRSHAPSLANLPTELQLDIFSHLDQIDSCCLGLTHPHLYVVFRAIHGTKMPLSIRRIGPNMLESAWEVVGKQECKQCGIYRCELHQHIKTWMPEELEYCSMKQNFGLRAPEGAKENCYRGKPSKPKRCGRHPLRTTSVHQDDSHFSLPTPAS